MTDDEVNALADVLQPYRQQVEARWDGRKRLPGRAGTVRADLLDIPTVAARLSCSRAHVYALIAAGELVRRDIGLKSPVARVVATSVDDYLARNRKRGVDSA